MGKTTSENIDRREKFTRGAAMAFGTPLAGAGGLVAQPYITKHFDAKRQDLAANDQAAIAEEKQALADAEAAKAQAGREDIYANREEAFAAYDKMLTQQEDAYANQLAEQQNMAMQGLPEETKALMIDQTNRAAAGAVSGAESARGALGGALAAQGSSNDAYRQLASMDANQRLQNQQSYIQGQGQYAQNMGQIAGQRLDAENQLMEYNQQTYVDPAVQERMFLQGQSQQATDYQRAAQAAAMQNKAEMWNKVGEFGGQFANVGMKAVTGGMGGV